MGVVPSVSIPVALSEGAAGSAVGELAVGSVELKEIGLRVALVGNSVNSTMDFDRRAKEAISAHEAPSSRRRCFMQEYGSRRKLSGSGFETRVRTFLLMVKAKTSKAPAGIPQRNPQ